MIDNPQIQNFPLKDNSYQRDVPDDFDPFNSVPLHQTINIILPNQLNLSVHGYRLIRLRPFLQTSLITIHHLTNCKRDISAQ